MLSGLLTGKAPAQSLEQTQRFTLEVSLAAAKDQETSPHHWWDHDFGRTVLLTPQGVWDKLTCEL